MMNTSAHGTDTLGSCTRTHRQTNNNIVALTVLCEVSSDAGGFESSLVFRHWRPSVMVRRHSAVEAHHVRRDDHVVRELWWFVDTQQEEQLLLKFQLVLFNFVIQLGVIT